MNTSDTITAPATGPGGAIAIIRVSGNDAITIASKIFRPNGDKDFSKSKGYTLHYGNITDGKTVIDEVIISVFRAPRSYTGEDMVEISCHGSQYIRQEIINLLICKGARLAEAGEFTLRAFLSGKIDLSQAEAVADIISTTDRASHAMAINQMKGGYSQEFNDIREELLHLASMLELELDFSEEDVKFADRNRLKTLIDEITHKVNKLLVSFKLGNAIKEGIAVSIVGEPNVGKSTLLNALLNEDRAMVSEIAGTTRDIIEDTLNIDGVKFRFIDTAGIRSTDDTLEKMGIERTLDSIAKANIILYVIDSGSYSAVSLKEYIDKILELNIRGQQKIALVLNKIDKFCPNSESIDYSQIENDLEKQLEEADKTNNSRFHNLTFIPISAKNKGNINRVFDFLGSSVQTEEVYNGEAIVTNSRHYEALKHVSESLERTAKGMAENISSDLLVEDLREALYYLGTVTGQITTDEILGNIFSKFCIGK